MDINSRKTSSFIVLGLAVFFIIVIVVQSFQGHDDQYNRDQITKRKQKDEYFLNSSDSPLTADQRKSFTGLEYFAPDPKFRIPAKFIENPAYELIKVQQKGGEPISYQKAGDLTFKYQGKEHALIAFRQEKRSRKELFIPFKDLTSGESTYGGGRYFEARIINNLVILDFNNAYNPYCVFNPLFVCPIPPPENFLNFEMKVGEKMFSSLVMDDL